MTDIVADGSELSSLIAGRFRKSPHPAEHVLRLGAVSVRPRSARAGLTECDLHALRPARPIVSRRPSTPSARRRPGRGGSVAHRRPARSSSASPATTDAVRSSSPGMTSRLGGPGVDDATAVRDDATSSNGGSCGFSQRHGSQHRYSWDAMFPGCRGCVPCAADEELPARDESAPLHANHPRRRGVDDLLLIVRRIASSGHSRSTG